jgi:hypothetical protein
MMDKHCIECGKLISYGLRHRDMIFCDDECAQKFGVDPSECFFGGVDDTTNYQVCDVETDDYCSYCV